MREEKQPTENYLRFLKKMDGFIQRFLLLKPRFIEVTNIFEKTDYPFLSVEGIVCGAESFSGDGGMNEDENPYIMGFAFDIETCSDDNEELRKIGTVEGTFYNFDKIRADGTDFNDAFVAVGDRTYDAFEAMGIPESLADTEGKKCLNVFFIEKFSIEPNETRHGIGTATLWSLADAISHHFNRRVGIILANIIQIVPCPFVGAGFTTDFPTKEELDAYETAKGGTREFIAKVGFHAILGDNVWYFDTESDMPNFETRTCGPDETLTHLAIME